MDTYIKDNPLIVTLFCLLILIYCFVVLYGLYLQRKKYNPDVTKMSKEEIDSLSYQEKSLILTNILVNGEKLLVNKLKNQLKNL